MYSRMRYRALAIVVMVLSLAVSPLGLDKTLKNVRFSARPEGVKRIDGWQWADNPFIGKPEFKGLKVMMVLLNNWDIKDSNNKILVLHNDRGKTELRYFVADLGATFGKVYGIPKIFRIFIFKPDDLWNSVYLPKSSAKIGNKVSELSLAKIVM